MRSMIDLCFMCSNDNKCNLVDNKIVTQVEYLMPDIAIIKMKLPLRFCPICEKNLELFSTFKKDCMENSLRLEKWIKEVQANTDMAETCSTSETNINKIHAVYIKEEVLDESDCLQTKDSFIKEIFIKQEPLQEKLSGSEFGNVVQDIRTKENPLQKNTHLHEDNTLDNEDTSGQNYDDPNEVVSVNNVMKLTRTKKFLCNECKKWFSRKSHLATHMKLHTGVKDYQCNECKKCFSQKKSLAMHMTRHTGVKDFQCKECKKWFSQKSNLARHMKQHAGIKDFQCNECKKWFARKSHLTTHMKLHAGIKDIQCKECNKWFSDKSNLAKHMKVHTKVKDF